MRTPQELRTRIQALYDVSDRMNLDNYLGRRWVASYVADADIVADCLLDILDGAELPKDSA